MEVLQSNKNDQVYVAAPVLKHILRSDHPVALHSHMQKLI